MRPLLVALLVASTPAYAGEPCRRAVHVEAGAIAPCTGDLLPVPEVVRLLGAEDALARALDALSDERDLRAIDGDEAAQTLAIERAARRECELAKAPPPVPRRAWYESPWFGAALGAGVVAGVVALTR